MRKLIQHWHQELHVKVFGILLWQSLLCWAAYDTSTCSSYLGSNGIRRDYWTSINGGFFLKHLKQDRRFLANILYSTDYHDNFEAPKNFANFYGQRLSAYFIPRVTGSYTFVATCDSECEILLSRNEVPDHKRTIIYINQNHRTKYEEWNKKYAVQGEGWKDFTNGSLYIWWTFTLRYAVQRSCPQMLEGHVIYYIEALHSNFKDDDHVRLRVVYPGQTVIQGIETTQLVRYSDTPLQCFILRSFCGFHCGGSSSTIIREIDPRSKVCIMNSTAATRATTIAVTTVPNTTISTTVKPTSNPLLNITTRSTSSTTIDIFWHFRGNYVPSGILHYRLNYHENSSQASYSTIVSGNYSAVMLTGLKKFTLYCIRILFVAEGEEGKSNGCTYARTKEDVPSMSPTVQVTNKALTSILVTWQPIHQQHVHGTLKGYKIHIANMNNTHAKPEVIKTGSETHSVTVYGMQKRIQYCVKVLGFTGKGDGPSSQCAVILTWTDVNVIVPSTSPIVRVTNKALTSILVTWQPIHQQHVHGTLKGYKIHIANMNDTHAKPEVIKTGSKTHSVTLYGMQKRIQYCVKVLGFTIKGDGPYSQCAVILTWTDDMLPKMTIHNYTTTTTINITWDSLPGYLRGHVTAYRLSYTAIESEGGGEIEQPITHVHNVTASTTVFTINDLKIFSVYRIEVRPLTRQGIGHTTRVAYGATCRCQPYLNALWSPAPPYAVKTQTGTPSGIIPKLLSRMVADSCGYCIEYNHSKIIYRLKSARTKRGIAFEDEEADFIFPIRRSDRRTYDDSEVYIPLLEVPGFAFLTAVKTDKAYARQVASSVLDCWPVLAITLAMTLLSGVLLWIVELAASGNQSRTNFLQGIFDGIWWSFITMTTVGYGDKIPSTNAGRTFAILWLLIGVVTAALLVGSITSSLSVKILKEHMYVKRDKRIASVEDPLDYKVLMKIDERASTRTTYQDTESLIGALKDGRTEGIIIDMYMAGFRTDLLNGSWYKVASILDQKFYYGVSINGNAATLAKKFRDHSMRTYEVEIKLLQEEREKESVSNQFYVQSQTVRKDMDLLNPKTLLYRLTVFFLLTILGCTVMIGVLVHSWKRNRDREKYTTQVTDPRDQYYKVRQEMKVQLETFYKQFLATYLRLKIKHRQELLEYIKYKKARQHEIIWL